MSPAGGSLGEAIPPPLRRRFVCARTGETSDSLWALRRGRALDPAGVADLLAWGFLPGERTLLRDVRWERAEWALAAPELHPRELASPDLRADRLWVLLRVAVAEALRGGEGLISAPCARPLAALSGGLDSRAVAAAAAELGVSFGTFGDQDCADLAIARQVALALGASEARGTRGGVSEAPGRGRVHRVEVLAVDAAAEHEDRVFLATGGLGGPDAAPGAPTDACWADHDLLLSGMSGDVVWGDTRRPGPSPASRLARLGVTAQFGDPTLSLPPLPGWAHPAALDAWQNLWTRQARCTWNGVLPRLAYTHVAPIPWHPAVLAFCLALPPEDRADRVLLRRMLARHAPAVAAISTTHGPVHDLDRAFASAPAWKAILDGMIGDRSRWHALGLRPRAVARALSHARDGARARSGLVSRLRLLWRWAEVADG